VIRGVAEKVKALGPATRLVKHLGEPVASAV